MDFQDHSTPALDTAEQHISADAAEGGHGIVPHPGNPRVAMVMTDSAFLEAARSDKYDAVMHMGFQHDDMDSYYGALTSQQRTELSTFTLQPEKSLENINQKYEPVLANTFSHLHGLFLEATQNPRINFKLAAKLKYELHTHLAPNMTISLGGHDGTRFEGGITPPGVPLFFKPGFYHGAANKDPDRQVAVLSSEYNLSY